MPDVTVPNGQIVFGSEGLGVTVETKADEVTSLSSFYVTAVTGSAGSESSVWNSVQFSQVPGSSPASYAGNKYWPASDPGYKFYGSNVTMTHSANGPYVDATTATDIVCGVNASPVYKSTNGLTLKHIFGRIGPVVVSSDAGYVLSGASLYITPNTGGRYHLRAGDGQVDGTGWSNLTAGTPVNLCNADGGTKVNDLYLVPGSYELTATWTMSKSGGSHTFTDKVVEVEIPAGQYNTITLNFGDGGLVYSVVTQFGEPVSWSGPLNDPEEIDWEVLLP